MKELIPIVSFSATANGLTISVPKLNTPRFVPFDISGKCTTCRADDVEIDYVITLEGIHIIKKFVAFDIIERFGKTNVFRFKTRRKVFSIQVDKEKNLFRTQSINDDFFNLQCATGNGNSLFRSQSIIDEYLEFPPEKRLKLEEKENAEKNSNEGIVKEDNKAKSDESENIIEKEDGKKSAGNIEEQDDKKKSEEFIKSKMTRKCQTNVKKKQ
uniref:Uncharacterized protein n=1 Tax=Meloidogyne enterolobii TaxID=390850 RepID=A0A6V7Y2Q7_MELEN|nr:unnamed protein product [Meloidogyne enterolobii]